jgi:transcriptional regulator with XRE-family HTH domain
VPPEKEVFNHGVGCATMQVRHDEDSSLWIATTVASPLSGSGRQTQNRKAGAFLPLTGKPCQVPFLNFIMLLVVTSCQALLYTRFMPQPRKKPQPIDNTSAQSIAKRIKAFRQKRGYTQAELADLVDITREAIAAYESGRVRLMDDMIVRFSKALDVSSDELLGITLSKTATGTAPLRVTRRLRELESLPEPKRKVILKVLDDLIRANS